MANELSKIKAKSFHIIETMNQPLVPINDNIKSIF